MKLSSESTSLLTLKTSYLFPQLCDSIRGSQAPSTPTDCYVVEGGPHGPYLTVVQGLSSPLCRISLLGQSLRLETSSCTLCTDARSVRRAGPGRGHLSVNKISSSEGEASRESTALKCGQKPALQEVPAPPWSRKVLR